MSRDKKIEEMAKVIASVPPLEFAVGGRCQGKHIYTLNKFAETLYEAGYRKQSESFSRPHENDSEWISVEERLPEEGGTYLVVLKEKHECEKEWNYHVDVASFTFEWDCIFNDWDEGQGIEITHWMPLPEPPKKGGGE